MPPINTLPSGDAFLPSLELAAGLSWVGAVWVVGLFLIAHSIRAGDKASHALCWVYAAAMCFEGFSFIIMTHREHDAMAGTLSRDQYLFRTALWALSQSVSGGFGWAWVLLLFMSATHHRTILAFGITSGVLLGLVCATLTMTGGSTQLEVVKWAWLCFFESMQLLSLFAAARLFLARQVARSASGLLLAAQSGMLALHFWQIYFSTFDHEARRSWSNPLKLFLNIPIVLVLGIAIARVADDPAYAAAAEKAAETSRRAITRLSRNFASPEYYWGLTLVVLAAGYGSSALCLRFFAGFDRNRDPILHMYSTYHPCILLDYLPGTLFAQPLFDLSVLLYQVVAVLALVRTVCIGGLGGMLHQALTSVLLIVATTIFELVFTFNPSKTSPLAHSLPFIGNQSSIAFFLLSQMAHVYFATDPAIPKEKRMRFVAYALIFAVLELGGMAWMAVNLLTNLGYGENYGTGMAIDPNAPVDNSHIHFKALPFILAVLQIFNQWIYAITSPLKFRPLVFDILASDVAAPARLTASGGRFTMSDSLEAGRGAAKLSTWVEAGARGMPRVTISARFFLSLSAAAMLTTATLTYFTTVAVLGHEETEGWGTRDFMRRRPGSVIAAVGWVVCAALLGCHVATVCVYEHMKSEQPVLLVKLAGTALVATSLLAHAGTIPGVREDYSWFLGLESFQVCLILWIGMNLLLNRSLAAASNAPSAAALRLDLAVGAGAIAALAGSIALGIYSAPCTLLIDGAWILLLIAFSFTDPRRAQIHLDSLHVATDTEVVAVMDDPFPGVPFFMMDLHGIKANLRAGAAAAAATAEMKTAASAEIVVSPK